MDGDLIADDRSTLARRTGFAMAWGQIGKVVEVLLATAIAIVAVRALQPQAFGMYSLLTNLAGAAAVLIPVVTLDALGAALPRIADRRERMFGAALVAAVRLAIVVVVAAAVVPLWGVLRDDLGLDPVAIYVLVAAGGYWVALDLLASVTGYYVAELELRALTLWKAAGQAATLAGLLVLVALDAVSVGSTLAVVSGGYLLAVGALLVRLRRHGRPRPVGREQARFLFGFTRHVWLIGAVSLALSPQVYVILIGAITETAAEVAYFVAAAGVIGRAQILLLSGWTSLIIPSFGALRTRVGDTGLAPGWKLFAKLWLFVAAPTSALLVVHARALVELLFGEAYAPAGRLLVWVAAFALVGAFLVSPPSVGALWALDRQRVLARVRLVVAPLAIVAAVVLIREYEALGAVIAAGLATVATSAVELVVARRAIGFRYPTPFALWVGATCALAAVPELLIDPQGALGLVASIGAGLALFVLAGVVARPFTAGDLDTLRRVSERLARSPLRRFARA